MATTILSYWRFLLAALFKGGQTGAIVPSQRFLIDKMIAPVPAGYRGQILELGPGTGALTLRLAARCPSARILACEINPVLAKHTQETIVKRGLDSRVRVIADSAEHLLSTVGQGGIPTPEFIISGIPLGNLGRERVCALIEAIYQALPANGLYVQFQYSMIDRKKIKTRFAKCRTIPVLLNFPPAVVYYARK
jgi:phosphatidylethanolamine/phosphatidyl-N-methylethanolamine N-methyltransferase